MNSFCKSKSRVYADINEVNGPEYSDYSNLLIQYGDSSKYEIHERLGQGKFSEVFDAVQIDVGQKVVIKSLKPIRLKKIKREIKVLKTLSQGENIITLLDIVHDESSNITSLIFEHVENLDFRELYPQFTSYDVRYYMFQLLQALDFAHSMGIMHRDVKPHNVMIDHRQRRLRLIDWGLSDYYHPYEAYNVGVASRCYTAPELLLDYEYYDYAIDLWSFGAILVAIVFNKEPFFFGNSHTDQLVQIARVLGTDDLFAYLEKYDIELGVEFEDMGTYNKKPWSRYANRSNERYLSDGLFDLVSHILVYDHVERYTAKEAMGHEYFTDVR